MATLKIGGSTSWLPTLLISLIFVAAVYFYKDREMKKAIELYEAQQTFLKEEVAKFGVIDSQFEDILAGRSITLQDIEQSQQRVDKLVQSIENIEKLDSVRQIQTPDSVKLKEALSILGI